MSRRKQAKPKALVISDLDDGDGDSSAAESKPVEGPGTEQLQQFEQGERGTWRSSPSLSDSQMSDSTYQSSSPCSVVLEAIPWNTGVDDAHPHQCEFCHKAFQKHNHLRKHEQVHADQLPYCCDICQRLFRHKRSRDRHMKSHMTDTRFNCSKCDASFSRCDNLKLHLKTCLSEEMPYQCALCNVGYDNATDLTTHMLIHTTSSTDIVHSSHQIPAGLLPFQCRQCNVGYDNSSDLETHMLIHSNSHGDDSDINSDVEVMEHAQSSLISKPSEHSEGSIEKNIVPNLSSKGEETPCSQCDKIFMSKEGLDFHVKQMHSMTLPCPVCYLQLSHPTELYEHLQWHSQLSYEKSMDNLKDKAKKENLKRKSGTFDDKYVANNANSSTAPNVKLECPICGKSGFDNAEVLQMHVIEKHGFSSAEAMASSVIGKGCYICEKTFGSQEDILLHVRKDHPREYMYIIERIHKGIGNVAQSFPCQYCPLNFGDAESLSMHQENVHKKMGISSQSKSADTVLCAQCNHSFPNIYSLAQHVQEVHGSMSPYINNTSSSSTVSSREYLSSSPRVTASTQVTLPVTLGAVSVAPSPKAGLHIITPEGLSIQSLPDKSPSQVPTVVADIKKAENPVKSEYPCDKCSDQFTDKHQLSDHMRTYHSDLYHPEVESSKDTAPSSKSLPCPQCQMVLGSEEEYENHITVHFLALGTEYGCTSCMKLFSKPDELQKHLIDIHAHHLYRCSLCKEVFDSKVNIQVHFAIKHSNECKLYKCTKCVAIFRSEMEWQLHVKVQHLGISKPYCCLFCKSSFTTDDDLQQHLTTHKKQFECQVCKEGFHVEYLLDKHMTEHHSEQSTLKQEEPRNTPVKDSKPAAIDLSLSPRNIIIPSTPPRQSALRAALQASPSVSTLSDTPNSVSSPHGTHQVCKCEICGMKFTSEESLIKHKSCDHNIGASDMEVLLQKNALTPKVSQLLGVDKFGQVCVYCTQNFKTKSELEKHMKIHVSPSKQKCNICDQIFPSASVLAEHKLTHCKVVRGDVCVICKLVMKNEEHFYVHSQEHGLQGTTMTCIVCRQTLASILELQLHGKAHFQAKNISFTCCVCLKTFETKENLIAKMNSSGKSYYVCKPCYHGEVAGSLPCKICNAVFNSQMELETHMALHKKTFQCIKCQESFETEYDIQMHVASHMMQEGNRHECRICNHSFDSPARLQCHLIEHTFEGSEMKCYVCESTFNESHEVQLHVLTHGAAARRYCCSQCNQTFFFSAEMQNHLYVAHNIKSSDTSYKCPECAKVFTNITNLNNHRKLHETLKDATLKCTKCPLTFRSFTEVQQHFVMVHSPQHDQEKVAEHLTHTCSVCGEMFVGPGALAEHAKLHSSGAKYSCSKCSKAFHSYQNFETHMKCHETGGPFVCTVCQKSFSRKESMRSHMKCHTGIKPFRCDKCAKTFTHKSQLRDHVATHQDQTNCDACDRSFETPKDLWRHQVIMHNMKTGHTCHICNSTYSDATDLEFHMKRVHGLEKISWSVKDKCGHRCIVCNSPYKNLKDLEFHVQQIHGFNTNVDTYHSDGGGSVSTGDGEVEATTVNGDTQQENSNSMDTSLDLSFSSSNGKAELDSNSVIILKNDQNSNVESMDLSVGSNGESDSHGINSVAANNIRFPEPVCQL